MTDERRRDERGDDATVEAAWRKASSDEPPPHVDAAILAAAREEAHAQAPARRPAARQPWWVSWQPLAAAAGVVGIAFVLVQMLPRDVATRAPAPAASTEMQPPAQRNEAAPSAPAPAPVAAPPAPEPAVTGKSVAARESKAADVASAETAERPAPADAAADAAAGAAVPSAAAPLSPEEWARRIAALHANGNVAAAAGELRAFRAAYPDADRYLPPTLRTWAVTVPAAESP